MKTTILSLLLTANVCLGQSTPPAIVPVSPPPLPADVPAIVLDGALKSKWAPPAPVIMHLAKLTSGGIEIHWRFPLDTLYTLEGWTITRRTDTDTNSWSVSLAESNPKADAHNKVHCLLVDPVPTNGWGRVTYSVQAWTKNSPNSKELSIQVP